MPETGQTALLGPIDVVASPDGKTLYVADAKQISVVDADGGKVSQSIAMPERGIPDRLAGTYPVPR